jgi:hypothetical protein
MFLDNRTPLSIQLKRGVVVDDQAVLCVGVEACFAGRGDGLVQLLDPQEPKPSDPPDPRDHLLWRGTSVTAVGPVPGPARAPFVQPVMLRVGHDERRLVVFGERRWERRGRQLLASEPAPFEALPLEWQGAFGGTYQLAPGYDLQTHMPHPGGTIPHLLNPVGLGYQPSAEAAEGQLLPFIEDPQNLVRRWDDSPTPVGFTPCPELVALRAAVWAERLKGSRMGEQGLAEQIRESIHATLWLQHHASPPLIFDELSAGDSIELSGMGDPFRLVVPPCPSLVSLQAGDGATTPLRPRLRSLHLDVEARTVRVSWGCGHRYQVERPPHWIHAEQARAAA